jgi:hypothetical protein
VRRVLLSPAWWGRHLLLIVVVTAFVFLGRWQWDRAMARTGTLQNLLYAVEWWLFAGLAVLGWAHMVRDEIRGVDRRAAGPADPGELPSFAVRPAVGARDGAEAVQREAEADTAEDAELAAYNAYLRWLHANPRR